MNESDLENDLRTLRPAQPGADLAHRIAEELSREPSAGIAERDPRTSGISGWKAVLERLCWAGMGAAAAVWIMHPDILRPGSNPAAALASGNLPPAAHAQAVQPSVQEEELSEADEGVHFVQANTPMKKVRRVMLERRAWSDPKGGGTLEVQWPREEVIFMPVPVQ